MLAFPDRADPLPAPVLLLEGARLSIHAVRTICQNRVGYVPLTPVGGFLLSVAP